MYSDCIPVLQIINIFWLDLTLLKGPGLRSGYGTPPDLVIWLLWSTSTKVNQDLPWSALVQGNQSQPGFALVSSGPGQPKSTRNYHGQLWAAKVLVVFGYPGPELTRASPG